MNRTKWIWKGIFVCALVVLGAWLVWTKLGTEPEVVLSTNEKAVQRAQSIATSLIEKKFELTRFVKVEQRRGIASEDEYQAVSARVEEGEYGRDPWGQPFHFKVNGDKVSVWSGGENLKVESSAEQLKAGQAQGDDIAAVAVIK